MSTYRRTQPGSKHCGWQECECCFRDFLASKDEWTCPHCGYDNRAGLEFRRAGMDALRQRIRDGVQRRQGGQG